MKTLTMPVHYKITAAAIFICMILFLFLSYSNLLPFTNWQTYHSDMFSVRFPGAYETHVLKYNDIPVVDVEFHDKNKELRVNVIDYSNLDNAELNDLFQQMGLNHSFLDSLTISANDYLKKVIIAEDSITNIKTLQDQQNTHDHVMERTLYSQFKQEGSTMNVRSETYIDPIHKKYYLISANYTNHGWLNQSPRIANNFLESFQIQSD